METTVVGNTNKDQNFYHGSGIMPNRPGVNLTLYRRDRAGKLHAALLIDAETGEVEIRGNEGIKPFLELKNNKLYINGEDLVAQNNNLKTQLTKHGFLTNQKIESLKGQLAVVDKSLKSINTTLTSNLQGLSKQLGNSQLVTATKMEKDIYNLNSSVNAINKKMKINFTLVDKQTHPIVHLKHKVKEMEAKLDSIIRQLNPPVEPDTRDFSSWARRHD